MDGYKAQADACAIGGILDRLYPHQLVRNLSNNYHQKLEKECLSARQMSKTFYNL